MLDFMVDQYLPVLDTVEDRIEQIEEQILENPTPRLLADIFALRHALIDFRRVALAGREAINHLLYRAEPWIHSQQPYFRNIYDHIVRALDFAETYRDILTGVLDVHLSATANRTNDIMKRLTAWATVAIPFLLITGFFGMNFPNLPWLDSSLGWVYASLAMIAVGVAISAYFKNRDWF
jgi:magnesium transporter